MKVCLTAITIACLSTLAGAQSGTPNNKPDTTQTDSKPSNGQDAYNGSVTIKHNGQAQNAPAQTASQSTQDVPQKQDKKQQTGDRDVFNGAVVVKPNSPNQTPSSADSVPNIFKDGKPGAITLGGVTLYGVLDFTFAYQQHGEPPSAYINGNYLIGKNANTATYTVTNNALSQSVVGLRFNQSLDRFRMKGFSIGSETQIGFDPSFLAIQDSCKSLVLANGKNNVAGTTANADSSRCGQIFNGELYATVKHDKYGQFRYGRQTSLMFYYIGQYDPQELSFANSPFGLSGTYAGSLGSSEDKHWNNSLKYLTAAGPVHGAIQYRFSGQQQGGRALIFDAGLTGTGFLKGASVDYNWGHFNDGISPSSLTSSTAAIPAAGSCQSLGLTLANCTSTNILNAVVSDNTGWAVFAKYNFEKVHLKHVTLMAGYENVDYSNPRHALAPGYRTIGGYLLNYTPSTFTTYTTDKYLHISWGGGQWYITPKLKYVAAFYHFNQPNYVRSGAACTNSNLGTATAVQCAGSMSWFSTTLDYIFAKRLDAYTAYSYNQETGGLTNGDTFTSTNNVTSGFRFSF